MSGRFGHNILRDPQLLRSSIGQKFLLDSEGLILIRDGLQVIATLKALYTEWTEVGRPTSTSGQPSVPMPTAETETMTNNTSTSL